MILRWPQVVQLELGRTRVGQHSTSSNMIYSGGREALTGTLHPLEARQGLPQGCFLAPPDEGINLGVGLRQPGVQFPRPSRVVFSGRCLLIVYLSSPFSFYNLVYIVFH